MINGSTLLSEFCPVVVTCRLLTPRYFHFPMISCFRYISYAILLTLAVIDPLVLMVLDILE